LKSLYIRIYVTLVAVMLAFAFGSAWLFQRQMEQERGKAEAAATERLTSMAVLIHRALPDVSAPREEQAESLREWGLRLRIPIALVDGKGERIGVSEKFERYEDEPGARFLDVPLDDGRRLIVLHGYRPQPGDVGMGRPVMGGGPGPEGEGRGPGPGGAGERGRLMRRDESFWAPFIPLGPRPNTEALVVLLALLFLGVAAGAYPVVRRLTRRLESLKRGVEQFGDGHLSHRLQDGGKDEVAALASSFNRAAERIEALVHSHQSLLANASHEFRSPLARLKMAFSMLEGAGAAQQARLQQEIHTNIAELDALVEEVLLASRLESGSSGGVGDSPVDVLALAAEETSRFGAELELEDGVAALRIKGDERLLRRALRNLLENARRYGGAELLLQLRQRHAHLELRVCDRGPGVPPEMRERIFEAFFRLPGHAEQAGGVGLGLSLVRQIALRHRGSVHCEAREGGGSIFVLRLPVDA